MIDDENCHLGRLGCCSAFALQGWLGGAWKVIDDGNCIRKDIIYDTYGWGVPGKLVKIEIIQSEGGEVVD